MRAKVASAVILLGLLCGCGVFVGVTHLTSLYAANDAFTGETMLVIRDQQSWESLWSRMTHNQSPPPALPAVDFSQDMVLVATPGGSTGRSVKITGATALDSELRVDVTITSPGSHCYLPAVVETPVDVATTPMREGTVTFRITRKVRNC